MNRLVAGFNGIIHLVEGPLREPVMDVMRFQLEELLPRKDGAFCTAESRDYEQMP